MSSSDDDDDAASTARKALKRLGKALAALPPRDEQRNALPPAARASCDVAAAFALCAALHAKHRLAGGRPVHAELKRCKALMVRARAAEAELRPRVDAAAAARHVAGALGAQPRHDEAARAAAVAPSAEPLPPPPSEADLGRKYNAKERKAVPAVIAYRNYEANGGDPPAPFTGKYACFENAAYRELLNKHGQPCNANPAAKAAFLTRFRYRSWPSVSAHPNKFNLDEYKEWQGGGKGKWVGFQWRLLGD